MTSSHIQSVKTFVNDLSHSWLRLPGMLETTAWLDKRQGSLVCCSPRGRKESDMAKQQLPGGQPVRPSVLPLAPSTQTLNQSRIPCPSRPGKAAG